MKCDFRVNSCVVKDTSPSKTIECGDSVHNSVVQVVSATVKSVVSETVTPGNSEQSDNVDTLRMVTNGFGPIETLNLDNSVKLPDQERHCNLHSCSNSCTYCVFSWASVPPVENVYNVNQNLPVRGRLRLLANMGLPGCKPESSVHSEKWLHPSIQGETPLVGSRYSNPLRNQILQEALHSLLQKWKLQSL